MNLQRLLTAVLILLCSVSSAWAQFQETQDVKGPKLGEAQVQRWQFGMAIQATGGPCSKLVGYVPLPTEWPEQQLSITEEDFSPNVRVGYEMVEGTVKLMVVRIPRLAPGEEAKAIVTYEVRRRPMSPPDRPGIYVFPDPQKLPRNVRPYLANSPLIESRSPKIKALLKQVGADKEKAWEKIEATYDWVRENVQHKKGPPKGALAALRDRSGGAEDLTALFVALCRAREVPARTVWVSGHCYPEFYLLDDEGKGHWFPCEMVGGRIFGGVAEQRPIVEKGDSFRPPYDRRERQSFLKEYLTGEIPPGAKPKTRFIRVPAGQ